MLPMWSFLAAAVPLVLTPGASTAVVLRNSLTGGVRAGVETALGANTGSLLYGLLSAFGLALALREWPSVWTALHVAGMLYLAWLGLQSLRHALWPPPPRDPAAGAHAPRGGLQNVKEGLLTNLLNPAIVSFYVVLLPQFVPRGAPVVRSVLTLTTVHISLAFSWHVVWAAAGGTMARTLSGGRPRRALDFCAGAALLALAIRMAAR